MSVFVVVIYASCAGYGVFKSLLGTLRSETRRLQDATGSKFSKRRHVAHAHAVVLVSPRRAISFPEAAILLVSDGDRDDFSSA